MKLFLDANVLFTAAHNPSGKAAFIIELGSHGHWQLVTSAYAVEEAAHNIRLKFPAQLGALEQVTARMTVIPSGPGKLCPVPLPDKDKPILEGAMRSNATHLLTGDIKDFGPYMNQPEVTAGIIIQTVAEFLANLDPGAR
ncbi:MAG: PIN domain-containing protein [Gammaproteobacteria bacterium]|nr:PIN domain-containing protein [Gammaproteobacteria bacterium]